MIRIKSLSVIAVQSFTAAAERWIDLDPQIAGLLKCHLVLDDNTCYPPDKGRHLTLLVRVVKVDHFFLLLNNLLSIIQGKKI